MASKIAKARMLTKLVAKRSFLNLLVVLHSILRSPYRCSCWSFFCRFRILGILQNSRRLLASKLALGLDLGFARACLLLSWQVKVLGRRCFCFSVAGTVFATCKLGASKPVRELKQIQDSFALGPFARQNRLELSPGSSMMASCLFSRAC